MKAILHLRKLLTPLLLGGALLGASLPALADRDHRRYDPPRHDHRHWDNRKPQHHHHHYRGGPSYPKYVHSRPHGVVHHYYFAPAPHWSPPPRVYYSYDPAVVVRMPPIVIKLN